MSKVETILKTAFSFLVFTLFLSPTFLHAQQEDTEISPEVELQVLESDNANSLLVNISLTHPYEGKGYLVDLKYPDFLKYEDIVAGGFNCPAEVVESDGLIQLSCRLEGDEILSSRGSLGTLSFMIEASGEGDLRVTEASVDDLYLKGDDLNIKVQDPYEQVGFISDDFTSAQLVLWLGLISMVSGVVLIFYVRSKKKNINRNDQLVFMSMVGLLVVSVTSAFVISLEEADFDYRDEASVFVCERTCDERQCGDDGCGGSCGECENGFLCSEEGNCKVDTTQGDNVLGAQTEYVVTDHESGFVEYYKDINEDEIIDMFDYSLLVRDIIAWEREGVFNSRSDLNEDQELDIKDYLIYIEKIDE